MSKTKTTGAKHYEVLFIIPNKFTDDEAQKVSQQVEKILTDNKAVITFREYWGKKKLAYEIKHNAFGYYSLLEFDLEGSKLATVNKALRLFSDILRHQIVSKKKKTEEELEKEKKIRAKIEKKKEEIRKKETKNTDKAEVEKSNSKTKNNTKKTTSKSSNFKDLDQKLEGILNAKDLI